MFPRAKGQGRSLDASDLYHYVLYLYHHNHWTSLNNSDVQLTCSITAIYLCHITQGKWNGIMLCVWNKIWINKMKLLMVNMLEKAELSQSSGHHVNITSTNMTYLLNLEGQDTDKHLR